MDCQTHLKTMMMKGKMYNLYIFPQGISIPWGQGIEIVGGALQQMQLKNYSGGSISHRAVVNRVVDSVNNLSVSGKGARKKDYGIDALPNSVKKTIGSGNFESLKFNF